MSKLVNSGNHTGSFFFEVVKGNISGHKPAIIVAHNQDVDTASAEDIWEGGGFLVYLTAAETMEIASSDATDTSAGVGARTVLVSGLDTNYNEISETVTMNGVANVTTSNSYLRIHSLKVVTVGTDFDNAGNITATATTAATLQCLMGVGESISKNSQFTIPANKTGYILKTDFASTKTGAGQLPVVEFKCKVKTLNGAWIQLFDVKFDTASESVVLIDQPVMIAIEEKTDIRTEVSTTQNNTEVFLRLYLMLVDNG